jgi:hypothetical protein
MKVAVIIAAVNAAFVLFFFSEVHFPVGNILMNTSLGPDNFYESLEDWSHPEGGHTFSLTAGLIFSVTKFVLVCCTSLLLSLYLYSLIRDWRDRISGKNPLVIMLMLLGIVYCGLLFVSASYFDRYTIPVITIALILLAYLPLLGNVQYKYIVPVMAVFFYVSVCGTKDYLTINRLRWKAVAILKDERKATLDKINAGFEVNCWNDGAYSWWTDYLNLGNFDYLIQYSQEPGFKPYREFAFRRYFPFKEDKIFIFVREGVIEKDK